MKGYKEVETKEQLMDLLTNLVGDGDSTWENTQTISFIEALAVWLQDADGFYKNMGLDTKANIPSWQLFADAIQAATKYE